MPRGIKQVLSGNEPQHRDELLRLFLLSLEAQDAQPDGPEDEKKFFTQWRPT